MQEGPAARRRAIESALLDYHRSPGQYAVTKRQPSLLFASATEVLQLASGRSPEGQEHEPPSGSVRAAAAFFIRSALLHPGADHYALLGLDRGADSGAIKDRYRMMMRLLHPDFSGGPAGQDWPEDAASRVNQAHEVLSSADQRRAYDEQLAAPNQERAAEAPLHRFRHAAPQSTNANDRLRLKRLAAVFGAAGTVVLLATLYASIAGEKESLIQRAATRSGAAVVAALVQATAAPSMAPPASAAGNADTSVDFAVKPAAAAAHAAPTPASSIPIENAPAAAAETPTPPPVQASAPAAPMQAASPAASAVVSTLQPPAPAAAAAPARAAESVAGVLPAFALATPASASPVASTPPAPARATPKPGVTLAEVHPLLSKLLQQIESGWGDLVLSQLDRDARATPGSQALLQRYNALVDGDRPVKLSGVQFKGEPHDGRLVVTGQVVLHPANQPEDAPGKPFAIQAEFALREGTVVMTRLAPARED